MPAREAQAAHLGRRAAPLRQQECQLAQAGSRRWILSPPTDVCESMRGNMTRTSRQPMGYGSAPITLSWPETGLSVEGLLVRLPTVSDVDAVISAFADPELREAANLPPFTSEELIAQLPGLSALVASGRLAPFVIVDAASGAVIGGCNFNHFDSERRTVELGYWLFSAARGQGVATKVVRLLAQHAFAIGVMRVVAHVNVGNTASERVLERAGFTREGVSRSMPVPSGRVDKSVFSLLPGE